MGRLDPAVELLLQADPLGYGLDDEIGCRLGQRTHARRALDDLRDLSRIAAEDGDAAAGAQKRGRDAAAHDAGAGDEHVLDLLGHGRTPGGSGRRAALMPTLSAGSRASE